MVLKAVTRMGVVRRAVHGAEVEEHVKWNTFKKQIIYIELSVVLKKTAMF